MNHPPRIRKSMRFLRHHVQEIPLHGDFGIPISNPQLHPTAQAVKLATEPVSHPLLVGLVGTSPQTFLQPPNTSGTRPQTEPFQIHHTPKPFRTQLVLVVWLAPTHPRTCARTAKAYSTTQRCGKLQFHRTLIGQLQFHFKISLDNFNSISNFHWTYNLPIFGFASFYIVFLLARFISKVSLTSPNMSPSNPQHSGDLTPKIHRTN